MKLTNAIKRYSIIAFSFFTWSACHYQSKESFIIGQWQYQQIEGLKAPVEIDLEDHFTLDSLHNFNYQIKSLNKQMKGQWRLSNDTLVLHYLPEDTTRYFKINILSKYTLDLNEGKVHFVLSK
jgi:hypothetical protein